VIGLMRPLSITREAAVVGTNIEDALGAWIDECVVGQFEPGTRGAIAEVAKPSMTTPIVRDLLPPPGQRAGEAPGRDGLHVAAVLASGGILFVQVVLADRRRAGVRD
jgi:hypothetical protein